MSFGSTIYLAVFSAAVGIALVLVVVFVCGHLGIDITENLWVLAVPLVLSLLLNVFLLEIHGRWKRKQ